MTNTEIINGEMLLRGITEECHTFAAWKARGFAVKKGEKAKFKTRVWKRTNNKGKLDKDGNEKPDHFYLASAAFFGESQVERI